MNFSTRPMVYCFDGDLLILSGEKNGQHTLQVLGTPFSAQGSNCYDALQKLSKLTMDPCIQTAIATLSERFEPFTWRSVSFQSVGLDSYLSIGIDPPISLERSPWSDVWVINRLVTTETDRIQALNNWLKQSIQDCETKLETLA